MMTALPLLRRIAACLLISCCAVSAVAWAQTPAGVDAKPTGRITGRVLSDEKGVNGIPVVLLAAEMGPRRKPVARSTTDGDGRYTLTNVPAGHYTLLAVAPAFVVSDKTDSWQPGKPVNILPGETIEDIDFKLTRGSVITGRVTGADGRPVIAQQVRVEPMNGTSRPPMRPALEMTDDRGVYRIYGLSAGQYRVSVGQDSMSGAYFGGVRAVYERTFYPKGTTESDAEIIEVAAGTEAADIDIEVGGIAKTFKVSGRVLDAETGRPVPNINVFYGPMRAGTRSFAGGFNGGAPSNARGEFQLTAMSGNYGLVASPDGQSEWYSEPVTFEVGETDVSGLELKLRRGGSLSGVIVVEGGGNPATLARVSRLQLYASNASQNEETSPFAQRAQVNADRTFFIGGMRAGKFRIGLNSWAQSKEFSLLRVERGGVEQRDGIEIAAGEHVTGLRVVVAYGTAVIRGQVRVEGDALPEGTRMIVFARRSGATDASGPTGRPAQLDARQRFTIEGVPAGEYELTLRVFGPNVRDRRPGEIKQTINVGDAGEVSVTLVYENKPDADPKP
jgi:hypothetical protein